MSEMRHSLSGEPVSSASHPLPASNRLKWELYLAQMHQAECEGRGIVVPIHCAHLQPRPRSLPGSSRAALPHVYFGRQGCLLNFSGGRNSNNHSMIGIGVGLSIGLGGISYVRGCQPTILAGR